MIRIWRENLKCRGNNAKIVAWIDGRKGKRLDQASGEWLTLKSSPEPMKYIQLFGGVSTRIERFPGPFPFPRLARKAGLERRNSRIERRKTGRPFRGWLLEFESRILSFSLEIENETALERVRTRLLIRLRPDSCTKADVPVSRLFSLKPKFPPISLRDLGG